MANLDQFPNIFVCTLRRSLNVGGSETEVYLSTIRTLDGQEMQSGDFQFLGRGVLSVDVQSAQRAEFISFTGVDDSGPKATGAVRGLSFKNDAVISANKKFHAVGAPVIIAFGTHNLRDLERVIEQNTGNITTVDSNSATSDGVAVTSLTFPLTSSGLNPGIAVQVDTTNVPTISSVTYGGVPLVQKVTLTNGSLKTAQFFLTGIPAGTANVVITLSVAAVLTAGGETLQGVNQALGTGATNTNSGTSATPSVSLTTTYSNSVILDSIATSKLPIAYQPNDGQDLNWIQNTTPNTIQGASTIESEGTAPISATLGYDITQITAWVMTAMEIIPSGNDQLVKVDANDSTAGYLYPKLNIISSTGTVAVDKTVLNAGGDEIFQFDLTASAGAGGGGGMGGKPMTFALTDSDSNASTPISGYQDEEALVYISGTNLVLQDASGFIQSRDFTTEWASATSLVSYVLINHKIYVLLTDGAANARVYVYDALDLSIGGTIVVFSGQTLAYQVGLLMTSNGTNIFFNFDSGQSANSYIVAKFSYSLATMTYVSSTTCGSTAAQFSTTFGVDDADNYYGTSSGIFYQYDNTGTLQYTSGDTAATIGSLINWTNTFYANDDGNSIFVKLYLPGTELSSANGVTTRIRAIEDLVAGNTVGYATNIADGAIKAVWAQRLASTAIGTNVIGVEAVCEIDTDKYALVVDDVGVQYKVVIATLDRDTLTWSFGALSANVVPEFAGNVDIVKLDTDKFAVASFTSVTNPYTIRVRVCTVSGTTVTVGGTANFSEPSTDNANNLQCVQLGTDRFALVVGGTQAGSHCDLFEVTVSGTTPTIGTQEIIDNSTTNISGIEVIGTDKVAVINDKSIWIATVSGGVWTVGSPETLAGDTGVNTQILGIISNATDTVFVNTNGFLEYFTVSGTTITAVANATYTTTGGTATTLAVDNTDVFLINQSTTAAVNGASKLTVAGAAITLSPFAQFNIANNGGTTNMFANQILFGSDYFGVVQGGNNPTGSNLEFLFHVKGMTSFFIGAAESSAPRNNYVNVLISGVDNNQSGLTAGALYDPLEGGLTPVITPGFFTVQAQNSTSIKI